MEVNLLTPFCRFRRPFCTRTLILCLCPELAFCCWGGGSGRTHPVFLCLYGEDDLLASGQDAVNIHGYLQQKLKV